MKEQLERRIQELKNEFEAGQKMLAEIDARELNLRNTLIRISGAIQVLEEELEKEAHPGNGNRQSAPQGEELVNQKAA